jgi:hypothetical protein
MKRLSIRLLALGSLVATGLCSGPALALPDTVYVDPNIGLDTNLCTETSPCLTLAHAATQVADPGTIVILSSGSLAPVSITTGLTIACPSRACIIDGTGAFYGIQIVAPGKAVSLNGLVLEGYGAGVGGIVVNDVDRLALNDVTISDFTYGIYFVPGNGANSHLFVKDSLIQNSILKNVVIAPTSSNSVSAEFTGTMVHHANAGIYADASGGSGNVSVTISDSVIAFANNNAVLANGNAAGATVSIQIDGSDVAYGSGNCILANGFTASVTLTKTMVTQCGAAINNFANATLYSYGDNAINFNTSLGDFIISAMGGRYK